MEETNRKESPEGMNQDAFAILVKAAIGNRTQQQFAEACGVNPSTITRILQKSNRGASRPGLLQAIADNAAPESGVTLEALRQANGLLHRAMSYQELMASGYIKKVQATILNELLARGAEVRLGQSSYYINKAITFCPDIFVITDAAGEKGGIWLFELLFPCTTSNPIHEFDNHAKIASEGARFYRSKTIDTIGNFLLASMNPPEQTHPMRFSIVTAEPVVYSKAVEEFGETCVSTDISIILVNLTTGKVVSEWVLPKYCGETIDSYFMTTQPIEDVKGKSKMYINDMEDI